MPDKSSSHRPFAISVARNHDEVAVVAVGELDLASADRLGQAFKDVWAAGSIPIVLDLGQVDFIDSTALRMLLSLRNDAKRKQHALTLVPPAPPVRRIFELTGTYGLFDWRIDRPEP
jgi:anti-sigma B factor antagonist